MTGSTSSGGSGGDGWVSPLRRPLNRHDEAVLNEFRAQFIQAITRVAAQCVVRHDSVVYEDSGKALDKFVIEDCTTIDRHLSTWLGLFPYLSNESIRRVDAETLEIYVPHRSYWITYNSRLSTRLRHSGPVRITVFFSMLAIALYIGAQMNLLPPI